MFFHYVELKFTLMRLKWFHSFFWVVVTLSGVVITLFGVVVALFGMVLIILRVFTLFLEQYQHQNFRGAKMWRKKNMCKSYAEIITFDLILTHLKCFLGGRARKYFLQCTQTILTNTEIIKFGLTLTHLKLVWGKTGEGGGQSKKIFIYPYAPPSHAATVLECTLLKCMVTHLHCQAKLDVLLHWSCSS